MRFPFFAIAIFCIRTSFAQDVLPLQPLADTSKATVSLQESCSKDSIVSLSKESKDFAENSGYSDGDWAWTYECNEVVSTSYPVKETFYVHKKHPGYKVYAKGNAQSYEVERFVVKDNKIVWVSEVLDWSIWDPNTPTGLLQRRAYANNAYGVKRESAGVQAYIKYKLGLITSKQYRSVKVTL